MRNPPARVCALAGAFLLTLVAGCGGGAGNSGSGKPGGDSDRSVTTRSESQTGQPPVLGRVAEPKPPRRIRVLGFNDNAVAQGLVSPERDAQLLARLGANTVRITLGWDAVEAKPGVFDFTWADALYKAMSARGISVLWIPMFAPTWAAAPGCPPPPAACHAPPTTAHDSDWSDFVARVAQRYPRSAGIEVWNEPNYAFFWMPTPDPVRYTQLLKEAYKAVKRVAPVLPVISGGFGNKAVTNGPDVSLEMFLRSVFAQGGGSYMDAIGIHPYPSGADETPFETAIATTRAIRAQYGFSTKPIWLTETGWSTTGSLAISLADQALELTDLVRRASSMADVQALLVHTLLDSRGSTQDLETGFGVLSADGSAKPAALALQREFALQAQLKP